MTVMRLPTMLWRADPQVPGSIVTYPAPNGSVLCGLENSGGISNVAIPPNDPLVATYNQAKLTTLLPGTVWA